MGERGGPNLFASCYNDPVQWYDDLGGKCNKPIYDPTVWNDKSHLAANNCYTYACNRRLPPTTPGDEQQPGSEGGSDPVVPTGPSTPTEPFGTFTCPEVKRKARLDGLKDAKSGKCEKCWHLVQLVVGDHIHDPKAPMKDEGPDYHWYRQDSNGGWSSQHGHQAVGPQVTDPIADAKAWGYDRDCGKMCAKD